MMYQYRWSHQAAGKAAWEPAGRIGCHVAGYLEL